MIELRCGLTMHGKLDDGLLEVKCKRRGCGAKPGVIVLHTFDLHDGHLVQTKQYADPAQPRET